MLSAMAIVGMALMIGAILNGIKITWKRILYADHRSIFRFMGLAFATCSGCVVNSVPARQLTYLKTITPIQARKPVFVLVMICRRLEAY
jgi:hypothetical protein